VLVAALTNSDSANDFQTSWQRIAEQFDVLFTTELSIEQLKQTILQLAVMGKLVPQNPSDEPASVLLEKIAEEKAQLIAEKKIKKQKELPDITNEEKRFELPVGWASCRLAELIPQFQNGASSRGDNDGKDIIVLRLADIKKWEVSLADTRSIVINEKSIERYVLKKDDVLIIRVNGSADIVGRFITCRQNMDAIYCDHFIRMRFPIKCFSSSYLSLLGSSSLIRERISDLFVSTAGQKTVNQTHIGSLTVTLPPLAEQKRIVTKVDELMALCEQLKARLSDAQTTQLHLADAVVENALAK
jgi:type I restriction enzyme S subunit